jgi:hypothetical protein
VAETIDEAAPAVEQEDSTGEDGPEFEAESEESESEASESDDSVAELVEQAGKDAGTLAYRQAQLTASRHQPEVRQVGVDIAVALVALVALITAFAFGNWAANEALSSPLPGWRAPLVLAAIWIVVGAILLVVVRVRSERLLGKKWWRPVTGDRDEVVREREQARDESERALRGTLDDLLGAMTGAMASAVLPTAGGIIEGGDDLLDAADDLTDNLEGRVPGGRVINKTVDIALLPGRYCIRVVRTVFRVSDPG